MISFLILVFFLWESECKELTFMSDPTIYDLPRLKIPLDHSIPTFFRILIFLF